jgi:hypothetical protein
MRAPIDSTAHVHRLSDAPTTSQSRSRRARLLALGALSGVLAGCAGGSMTSPDAGARVWTASSTKVVADDRGGGFGPGPVAGAACTYGRTYTLTVGDSKLSWHLCVPSASGPTLGVSDGERVLTTMELADVTHALDMVELSNAPLCGADKGTLVLTITDHAGAHEYLDDFYVCEKKGTYVTNLDGVFQALAPLVK